MTQASSSRRPRTQSVVGRAPAPFASFGLASSGARYRIRAPLARSLGKDEFEDFVLDLVSDLDVPVLMDFPAGHEYQPDVPLEQRWSSSSKRRAGGFSIARMRSPSARTLSPRITSTSSSLAPDLPVKRRRSGGVLR